MLRNVSEELNRRGVLKHVAGGAVTLGLSGRVAAKGNNSGSGTGRYIIGTHTKDAAAKAKEKADTVHRTLSFGSTGKAVAGKFSKAARTNLEKRPDVRYVEADGQMRAIGQTLPWGVDRVDADVVHDDGYTGAGGDIAILDTGIDSDHSDLEANLGSGKSFIGCDSGCTSNSCHQSWDDDNGHGTHCAGIANAVNNSSDVVGVSTEATLHAVKVLDCDGYGSYSDIAAGVQHATDQGWDVASMSLGGGSSSSTLRDACQYAADNGTLVVAAAGNSGPCSDCVMYPAKYDTTIAVSATDGNDGLASFSSTGPEIEIAAPGASILSTVPGGTATYSGTSMACPHVSGAAGMLMANGYTRTEARSRLAETAEDLGLSGTDQGNGLLDVGSAVSGSSSTPYNVDTKQPENLGSSNATLVGELTGMGDASSVELNFDYWVKGDESNSDEWKHVGTAGSTGTYSADVSGLKADTAYVIQAKVYSDTDGWETGKKVEFTTGQSAYNVDTNQPENVDSLNATLVGDLTGMGDASSVELNFDYWVKGDESNTDEWEHVGTNNSTGTYSADVSGLESDTTYVVQAKIYSDTEGWDAGKKVEFTTGQKYNVDTNQPENVDNSSATLVGDLTGLGDASSVELNFDYWVKGDESNTDEWEHVGTTSSTGTYSANVSGLDSDTTYVVQAKIYNDTENWDAGMKNEFTTS